MSKGGNNPNSNTKYWIIIIVLLVAVGFAAVILSRILRSKGTKKKDRPHSKRRRRH